MFLKHENHVRGTIVASIVAIIWMMGTARAGDATASGRAGVTALVNQQYTEAVDSLKRAAATEPQNRLWQLNLGWAYNALKQADNAIGAFSKARTLTKSTDYYVMGWILWGLANAYETKKDCASLAKALSEWMSLTLAQSTTVRGRAIVQKQMAIAKQRIRQCPTKVMADRPQ
ncbi:MAG: hypothetical protein J7M25_06430 [Deltaproteobacteria bacterium]|nr:hypothetical protein [Deltaproteobacteria bacterium]